MRDYKPFKKVIKGTRNIDGLAVTVHYAPTRTLNQLESYIEGRRQVISSDAMDKSSDWYELAPGSFMYYESIKSEYLADEEESAAIIEDFMRLLALFTQDSMIEKLIKEAPRKIDGHLMANRTIYQCSMDGVLDNLSYYTVRANTAKDDAIDIVVNVGRMGTVEHLAGSCKNELDANKDLLSELNLT